MNYAITQGKGADYYIAASKQTTNLLLLAGARAKFQFLKTVKTGGGGGGVKICKLTVVDFFFPTYVICTHRLRGMQKWHTGSVDILIQ